MSMNRRAIFFEFVLLYRSEDGWSGIKVDDNNHCIAACKNASAGGWKERKCMHHEMFQDRSGMRKGCTFPVVSFYSNVMFEFTIQLIEE